ncbi:hypothetical protein DDE83_001132 [Stemphylium lycopersici]|uniref:Uncharacterized protein n=1 Tax=Stemphylium lycopersici TaxID=183478 RepID=A0A364NEG9_STELY|nr:hypothetical protein DDE83_001132 [Stemphylium lycopersici]
MLQFSFVLWLPYFAINTAATLHGQQETGVQELQDRERHGASTDERVQARSVEDKNSMQILYAENIYSYAHNWGVFFGPRGIPVDPCNFEPFSSVFNTTSEAVSGDLFSIIDNPPPTPSGTWSGFASPLADADCSIVDDASGPPTLQCGQGLTAAFAKDPGYDDPTIGCNEGAFRYRRAYFVEFTL